MSLNRHLNLCYLYFTLKPILFVMIVIGLNFDLYSLISTHSRSNLYIKNLQPIIFISFVRSQKHVNIIWLYQRKTVFFDLLRRILPIILHNLHRIPTGKKLYILVNNRWRCQLSEMKFAFNNNCCTSTDVHPAILLHQDVNVTASFWALSSCELNSTSVTIILGCYYTFNDFSMIFSFLLRKNCWKEILCQFLTSFNVLSDQS